MEEVDTYDIRVQWDPGYRGGLWEYDARAGDRQVGYGHSYFRWMGVLNALVAIAEHRANRRRASKTIRKTITRKKA